MTAYTAACHLNAPPHNLSHRPPQLKAMGINDLLGFDFMDPPPVATLISAMQVHTHFYAYADTPVLWSLRLSACLSLFLVSLVLGCVRLERGRGARAYMHGLITGLSTSPSITHRGTTHHTHNRTCTLWGRWTRRVC